ncbi:MAG: hypothetical protein Kow0077_11250 [Anaerolineae bacterium]
MSERTVSVLVCDGCGTVIDIDFYITRRPGSNQKVIQRNKKASPERHFCCAACEGWWNAQFPPEGPWGPAWDERDWWCDRVGPCAERARVRTAKVVDPLVDMEFHDRDPEPLG